VTYITAQSVVEDQLVAIYVERMIGLFCVKYAFNSTGRK